jgi:hypothetical protein
MRPLALFLLILVAAVGGAARAQGVSIAAPPDRFVAPGGFVTLVFRVAAVAAVDVEISVAVDTGWMVLRPPGRRALEAGRSTPIAVTIEVPSAAAAATRGEVRFVVDAPDGSVERVVVLTVTERIDVGLQAPAEYTIGSDGLEVVVTNGGNVEERAALELRRDGVLLDRRVLVLAPDAREIARFDPAEEGLFQLVLTTERGGELRRSVRVLRFGTGLDAPYVLGGEVGATIGTSGRSAFVVDLRGALSDFVTVDARVDAAAWSRSYAVAEATSWSVRLGAGWRDPFGLTLPADPGVSARWDRDAWGVAAHAGWLGDDRFGGPSPWDGRPARRPWPAAWGSAMGPRPLRSAPRRRRPRASTCSGPRVSGMARMALRCRRTCATDWPTHGSTLTGHDLTGAASRVDLSVRHRVGPAEVYADGTVPIGPSAAWPGRVGFRDAPDLAARRHGRGRRAGGDERVVRPRRVPHRGRRGVAGGDHGWGALRRGWVRRHLRCLDRAGRRDPIDLDARLDYRPATGRVGGRVGAQARFATIRWTWPSRFGWDLSRARRRDGRGGRVVRRALVVGTRRDGRTRLRHRGAGPVARGRWP